MGKKRKILLGTLIPTGFILVVIVGGLIFLSQSYDPMQEALDSLESSSEITISETKNWIVFDPTNRSNDNGFIFYPGGNVEPESYSIIARGVALNGSLVVIVKFPFDLAVFGSEKGGDVIEAFPEITTWIIGGHSLGGAMAARYMYSNPDLFTGLILLASYPADSNNLSEYAQSAISIYGSLDGIVDISIPDTISLLPGSTTIVEISGGNHANFGSYGDQKGDNAATIPRADQQAITIEIINLYLSEL